MSRNEEERIQKLERSADEVLYEYITTVADETKEYLTIPTQYLSNNYRIEITGITLQNNLAYIKKSVNTNSCSSGFMYSENNTVASETRAKAWACFFGTCRENASFNSIIDIRYNEAINGYSYHANSNSSSPTDNKMTMSIASGCEYGSGLDYDLQIGVKLKTGSKIRVIKQL